jgi:hypothetical protein
VTARREFGYEALRVGLAAVAQLQKDAVAPVRVDLARYRLVDDRQDAASLLARRSWVPGPRPTARTRSARNGDHSGTAPVIAMRMRVASFAFQYGAAAGRPGDTCHGGRQAFD